MCVKLPKAKKQLKGLQKFQINKIRKRSEDITIAASEIGQQENYENLTARFTVQNYSALTTTRPVRTP